MAIEMVRIPSETPNISNTDDFVGLRYAYGNQNGYVIGKGQECSYTINGSKFRVNSGRLVLQGVECDIDANGVEITIDNVATKKYYTVYLEVNLATNETKILAMSDLTSYPKIESGDDLTQNTTGTATMELYHFEATSGVISNVSKVLKAIQYSRVEYNLMSTYKTVERDEVVLINNFSEYKGKDVVFVVDGIEVTRRIYGFTKISLIPAGPNRSGLVIFPWLDLDINSSMQLVGKVQGMDYQGNLDTSDLVLRCTVERIFVRR